MNSVWDDVLGQPEALEQLLRAVNTKSTSVHHAWLFTGPPGSGRSNMAQAFAQAIICKQDGCGHCHACVLGAIGNHPDITTLSTEKVVITIDEVRDLVAASSMGASAGGYRVLIIEDADRMAERSSNVLLKALEEPPEKTVWILCAPSESDMLPTIRSRTRHLQLRVPDASEVAKLLVNKEGIEPQLALEVALAAQSHVGMARRLAQSSEARTRRRDSIDTALGIDSLSKAMMAAERWLDIAKKDAETLTLERDEMERVALMATLGLGADEKVPNNLRAEMKQLTENQKRRATRSLRDGLDRILLDLASIFRDISILQFGAELELVNRAHSEQLRHRGSQTSHQTSIEILDEIRIARQRLNANVRDLLALEAVAVAMIHRVAI